MTSNTKIKTARRFVLACLLLGAAIFGSARFLPEHVQAQRGGEFMIVNKSSYTFARLYLSPSTRRRWGTDQLGRRVVRPGQSFTLHGIPCGLYDIKLVDEDGDTCVVAEIPMCRDHTHWEVTDDRLLSCEGFR
jgi:hypothetical protein